MRIGRAIGPLVFATAAFSTLLSWGVPAHVKTEEVHLWTPMHDGVKLAAYLYRPAEAGRLPTILIRTPYGKGTQLTPNNEALVDHGYNVMVQDVRGRNESQGVFRPLTQEAQDGDDTINWIAAQSWSDAKVGMTGGSYLGMAAWKAATLNNPHLKAIFPVVSGDDDYRDRFYSPGGAMKWGHRLEWVAENLTMPGYEAPDFRHFIWTLPPRRADKLITGETGSLLQVVFDHPTYDAFWRSVSTRERLKDVRVPAFAVGGWYDNYVEGDLDAFTILRKSGGENRLLIGPWPHDMSVPFRTMEFPHAGALPVRRFVLNWFDEWLKDDKTAAVHSEAPLKLFVMGADVWRDEYEWPLARAVTEKWYLDGAGGLDENAPRGSEVRRYVYDPRSPVPTMGGAVCCNNDVFPWGPMDQRPLEKRGDVLVYSSEPLKEDTEVTGPVSLVLWASTSATDTDFTGKLVDVYPDGRAINLTDGILRARYRDGVDKPKLLKDVNPVKYTIDLGVTSNVFRKGHAIRLEVSSSNFPRFDRNPNTGRAIADESQIIKAAQTIYSDRGHRSYLRLPWIPDHPVPAISEKAHFKKAFTAH